MNKILFALSLLFAFSLNTSAQLLSDAVRYSQTEVTGTASAVGMGGGGGALGGDFTLLSTNPAGLAVYRSSFFMFTPAFDRISTDGDLDGIGNFSQTRHKNNFNISNLGLVFSGRPLDSKWRTSVFGIGFNRVANYHERSYFEGTSLGSITDRWLELAGDLPPEQLDNFETGLAYDVGAIYDPNPLYFSDFLDQDGLLGNVEVDKSQLIKRTGGMSEMVFSYAGNYDDKLMIGVTLGVPIMNFEETKTYAETDETDRIPFFDELTFTERVRTSGAGINLKLGLIYVLNEMVRLGGAIHSPTSLGLDDAYSTELEYGYTDSFGSQRFSGTSPESTFEYRLRTPWRAIGSAAVLLNRRGFLTAEVEYVDYTAAKFSFLNTTNQGDINYQNELNDQIKSELSSGLNLRLGGEYAIENYRLRAGYSIMASPYADIDENQGALSLGAGVRLGERQGIFLDAAYRRFSSDRSYAPYLIPTLAAELVPEPSVDLNTVRQQFLLTLGFRI